MTMTQGRRIIIGSTTGSPAPATAAMPTRSPRALPRFLGWPSGPEGDRRSVNVAVVVAVLATLILVAVAAAVVVLVQAARPSPACLALWATESGSCTGRELERWLGTRSLALPVHLMFAFVPLLVAGVLGAMAGKRLAIDDGRTGPAVRWSITRLFVLAIALAALVAVTGDVLQQVIEPTVLQRLSMDGYGMRGAPVVVRSIAVFGLAMVVGVALLRLRLSMLVSMAMAGLVLGIAMLAFPYGAQPRTMDAEQDGVATGARGDAFLGRQLLDGDGVAHSYLAVQLAFMDTQCAPAGPSTDCIHDRDTWIRDEFQDVAVMLPGTSLHQVEGRETLVLGSLAGAAALVASGVAHLRRRRRS